MHAVAAQLPVVVASRHALLIVTRPEKKRKGDTSGKGKRATQEEHAEDGIFIHIRPSSAPFIDTRPSWLVAPAVLRATWPSALLSQDSRRSVLVKLIVKRRSKRPIHLASPPISEVTVNQREL